MNGIDLLWRILMCEVIIILGVVALLLMLLVWWILRKLVVVPVVPRVTVATDKASYARGETVQISGTVTSDGAPEANKPVGLGITPPTGDIYSLPSVTTDAQGNFSASWQVPADAVVGTYVLTATSVGVSATTTFTL